MTNNIKKAIKNLVDAKYQEASRQCDNYLFKSGDSSCMLWTVWCLKKDWLSSLRFHLKNSKIL